MRAFIISLVILFSLSIGFTCAHQPRLVMDVRTSEETPIIIEDPEISKAYYGQLEGDSDYYKIVSDKSFELYLNILVPDIPIENERRFSVMVSDPEKKEMLLLNGTSYTWEKYFEEFGGDSYLKGPEARMEVDAGTYYIKVFNSDNIGKYSLAVGDIESFPASEFFNTIVLLPRLKQQFFNKPAILGLMNLIGLFVFVPVIVVIFVLYIILRRFRKKKKEEKF